LLKIENCEESIGIEKVLEVIEGIEESLVFEDEPETSPSRFAFGKEEEDTVLSSQVDGV
jgi:hypothetical protein